MENKILVAYASQHGSTGEIAAAIAADLREAGLEVDLQLIRQVRTLEGYQAVVLGAPLYMFRWHKDALRFLARHRQTLASGLPVAVFAGGPIETNNGKEWQETRNQLDKDLAKFPWFRPLTIEIVGGRFDPENLRFPWKLLPALRQMPPCDLRDWQAIHAWARSLAAQFQPALS
jgi:menaquinone-dependent protoporphyrinogen oxidase